MCGAPPSASCPQIPRTGQPSRAAEPRVPHGGVSPPHPQRTHAHAQTIGELLRTERWLSCPCASVRASLGADRDVYPHAWSREWWRRRQQPRAEVHSSSSYARLTNSSYVSLTITHRSRCATWCPAAPAPRPLPTGSWAARVSWAGRACVRWAAHRASWRRCPAAGRPRPAWRPATSARTRPRRRPTAGSDRPRTCAITRRHPNEDGMNRHVGQSQSPMWL